MSFVVVALGFLLLEDEEELLKEEHLSLCPSATNLERTLKQNSEVNITSHINTDKKVSIELLQRH